MARSRRREVLAPIIKEIQDQMWKPTPYVGGGLADLITDAPGEETARGSWTEIVTPQVPKREMNLAFRRMVQRDRLFVARSGCP